MIVSLCSADSDGGWESYRDGSIGFVIFLNEKLPTNPWNEHFHICHYVKKTYKYIIYIILRNVLSILIIIYEVGYDFVYTEAEICWKVYIPSTIYPLKAGDFTVSLYMYAALLVLHGVHGLII